MWTPCLTLLKLKFCNSIMPWGCHRDRRTSMCKHHGSINQIVRWYNYWCILHRPCQGHRLTVLHHMWGKEERGRSQIWTIRLIYSHSIIRPKQNKKMHSIRAENKENGIFYILVSDVVKNSKRTIHFILKTNPTWFSQGPRHKTWETWVSKIKMSSTD